MIADIDIRLPQINAVTDREQIRQIKGYLYQMAEQLKWALGNVTNEINRQETVRPALPQNSNGSAGYQDSQAVFNSIKALIIKSADIVDAYYQEINARLESEYVAQSDYGEYVKQTSAELQATSEAIRQNFDRLEKISADVDIIRSYSAYIKTGLLSKEGEIPVYGVEVGQTNSDNGVDIFRKYSRFTADRLSFYDSNEAEVAYISDYKMYIENAEITGKLSIGKGYEIIPVGGGLAFKWIGG